MIQVQAPFPLFFDKTGNPIDNGSVYIGEAGSNPQTNPIQVSWDVAGLIAAAQPLKISGGMVVRYSTPSRTFIDADDYSMAVYDKNGVLMWSTLSAKDPAAITNTAVNSAITAAAEAEAAKTAAEAAQVAAEESVADFDARLDAIEEDVTDNAALSISNANAAKVQTDGTLKTLTGASVDFTGIPADAVRVYLSIREMSVTTTSAQLIQVGTSAGLATSGYGGAGTVFGASALSTTQSTAGLLINNISGSRVLSGEVVLSKHNANVWKMTLSMSASNEASTFIGSTFIALGGALTQVRVTLGGAGTFDSGSGQISWELGHTIEEETEA